MAECAREDGKPNVKILGVCGSLQQRSGNLELLHAAARLAPEGSRVVVTDALRTLPWFDPEAEAPSAVLAWRAALSQSDAVLIATPEYGHSLPGALKNGIDWVIGSGELHRKRVAITAATNSSERGLLGLAALRQTLLAVDARLVGGAPIVRGEHFEREVRRLLEALSAAGEQ